MKIAILGSREYDSPDLIRTIIALLPEGATVLSRGATPIDKVVISTSTQRHLEVTIIKADYASLNRYAYPARDLSIITGCDKLIYFTDGTPDPILDLAAMYKRPILLYGVGGNLLTTPATSAHNPRLEKPNGRPKSSHHHLPTRQSRRLVRDSSREEGS